MNSEQTKHPIFFTLPTKIDAREITPSTIGEAPSYDEKELEDLIAKGTKAWADVPDSVLWVREQRDGK
ncbi:MAG: hypothetical protein WAX69_03395 [Victivallales bacterium]